ncbi:MAG: hypothetical protein K2X03_23645 [Bryobacteraceae bacterium]|nr:hypothetical protein [Bryobacteraceae bacterium]
MSWLGQVKQAVTNLSPASVRESAERPFRIGLFAGSEGFIREFEKYMLPATLSVDKRRTAARQVVRAADQPGPYDIEIFDPALERSDRGFYFDAANPAQMVKAVLDAHEPFALALARNFPPFRAEVTRRSIHTVSRENALFSIATAMPNIAPLLGLGWALGEFASDTAVLTANQVRLAFLLAAASDRPVGYSEQRGEIASIIAGAFGWRAIARELIGKIPLGGGLIPKAAVAYAGTYVMGQSFERLYRSGYAYSRQERKSAYVDAYDRGKAIVSAVVEKLSPKRG